MPTATASTGARHADPRALRTSSAAMMAAPTATPMATMPQGSPAPNTPCATDAISVAWGASSALGCSGVGAPMP